MSTMTREQAVKGAGERLTRLEETMRKLFYLAVATCAMVTVTTVIAAYGAYTYYRVMSAMSESMERLEKMPMPGIRFPGDK